MFANKQESRGALSAETDSESRNTLANPLTWREGQMWVVARAPRVSHRWRCSTIPRQAGDYLRKQWAGITVLGDSESRHDVKNGCHSPSSLCCATHRRTRA
jgi:hypothetical protein